jgi:deazaflavin-dependent oxidoreductase (nitroreductase family)
LNKNPGSRTPEGGRKPANALKPLSKCLPGFTVIKHSGRTSGTPYETIVTSYRKGNALAVMLGKTNWVKKVLAAGEADVHMFRGDVHITNPRILPAGTEDASLPRIACIGARRTGVFVADLKMGAAASAGFQPLR